MVLGGKFLVAPHNAKASIVNIIYNALILDLFFFVKNDKSCFTFCLNLVIDLNRFFFSLTTSTLLP